MDASIPAALAAGLLVGMLIPRALRSVRGDLHASVHPAPATKAAPETPSLERYEDLEYLREGDDGALFGAWDPVALRHVALQRIELRSDSRARRLAFNARVLLALDSPRVVPVHEVVVDGRFVYLVVPRLSGRTLADRIAAARPDLRECVRIVAQIAAGLDLMHEIGVAHHDLRPERIPIDEAGDYSVTPPYLPFRFREPTVGGPWPFYLAPEAVRGMTVDGRADIYSLGAILFELLTGRVPFESDEWVKLCVMHVQDEPSAPSELNRELDAAVDGVVARALAKNPEERYPSASDLARALTEAAGLSSSQSCSSNTTVPKHT